MDDPDRPPARAARGAAPRHESRQRPLPDRLRQLERGAVRRARARAALHRLPLHRGGAGGGRAASRSSRRSARSSRGSAETLSGRVGFEASMLPWSFAEELRAAGLDLVPRAGLVEQLRAVKDDGELDAVPAARARSPTGCSSGSSPRCSSSAAASATSPGTSRGSSTRKAPRRWRSSRSSAPARRARGRTRAPGDKVIETGELVVIDTGCNVGGYVLRLHAHVRDRRARRARCARRTTVVLAAQQAGLDAIRAGVTGVDADAAARARHRRQRLRRHVRPRARPRARPRRPRGSAPLDGEPRHARAGQRRHRRAGHLRQRPLRRSASRTTSSSPATASRTRCGSRRSSYRGRLARHRAAVADRSTPTSSRTACTSSSTARRGASSSSSM